MEITQTTTASPGSAFPINQVVDEPVDAPVADDLAPESPDTGSEDAATQAREAAEQEAADQVRPHGWVDRQEWVAQGKDPARWRPASEFLEFRKNLASV